MKFVLTLAVIVAVLNVAHHYSYRNLLREFSTISGLSFDYVSNNANVRLGGRGIVFSPEIFLKYPTLSQELKNVEMKSQQIYGLLTFMLAIVTIPTFFIGAHFGLWK